MDHICKKCLLFNERDNVCAVTVIVSGEHYELPVLPDDECHWERIDREIQSELQEAVAKHPNPYFKAKWLPELDTPIEVKQVRMWSNGVDGFIETPTD